MRDAALNTSSKKDIVVWRNRIQAAMDNKTILNTRSIFHELNPHLDQSPLTKRNFTQYRDAAVLFPIIDRESGPTVLFTVRSKDMPSHAGQISFPGGGVGKTDVNRVATALREAEEEVGIAQNMVDVIGDMGVHFGGKGFAVTPIIGVVQPSNAFEPCPREVEQIFEAPLDYLLDQDNHIIEERENSGMRYRMPAIPYEDYHIWGLTAGIINSLAQALRL